MGETAAEVTGRDEQQAAVLPGGGEARSCVWLFGASVAAAIAHLAILAAGRDDGQMLLAIVQIAFAVAAGAALLLWLYEAQANLSELQIQAYRSPSCAVAAFFVPGLNLFQPVRVVQDLWRASDPTLRQQTNQDWRHAPGSPVVWIWWFSLLALLPAVGVAIWATFSSALADAVDGFDELAPLGMSATLALSIVCSVSLMRTVGAIQRRQELSYARVHAPWAPLQLPRFSWPVRLFLTLAVFDIVFHSLATLAPYRDWLEENEVTRFPKRLPTRGEMASLSTKMQDQGDKEQPQTSALGDRVFETLDSVWAYVKPWPGRATRAKLATLEDHAGYYFCWLTSRLDFCEHVVLGTSQRWTMFSPNAARGATMARTRLLYADGSVQEVRLTADPPDLTRYAHWFEEKTLDYELKVAEDWDSRVGYCNYLTHRFARNTAGSPLDKVYVYKFRYEYPAPDEDAVAKLRAQNGPPNWDKDGPFFVYDAASRDADHHRRGRKLADEERKTVQARLAQASFK